MWKNPTIIGKSPSWSQPQSSTHSKLNKCILFQASEYWGGFLDSIIVGGKKREKKLIQETKQDRRYPSTRQQSMIQRPINLRESNTEDPHKPDWQKTRGQSNSQSWTLMSRQIFLTLHIWFPPNPALHPAFNQGYLCICQIPILDFMSSFIHHCLSPSFHLPKVPEKHIESRARSLSPLILSDLGQLSPTTDKEFHCL